MLATTYMTAKMINIVVEEIHHFTIFTGPKYVNKFMEYASYSLHS